MNRLPLIFSLFLLIAPSASGLGQADESDTVPELWKKANRAKFQSYLGSWRDPSQWRLDQHHYLLGQIVEKSKPESSDWYRGKFQILKNKIDEKSQLDTIDTIAQLRQQLAKTVANKPDQPGLVRAVGFLMEAELSTGPINKKVRATCLDYLTKKFQANGPDAPEACYWLQKQFITEMDIKQIKVISQALTTKYKDTLFGQWERYQILLSKHPKEGGEQDLIKFADEMPKSPIGYLALSEAAKRKGYIKGTYNKLANEGKKVDPVPAWTSAMEIYLKRQQRYPQGVALSPLPEVYFSDPDLREYNARYGTDPSKIENQIAQYWSTKPDMGNGAIHSALFRAYKEYKVPRLKAILRRIHDKAAKQAPEKNQARMALGLAFYLYLEGLHQRNATTRDSEEILESIVKKYPTSPSARSALDLLAFLHRKNNKPDKAATYWNQLLTQFPNARSNDLIRYELALLEKNMSKQKKQILALAQDDHGTARIRTLAYVYLAKLAQQQSDFPSAFKYSQLANKFWPAYLVDVDLRRNNSKIKETGAEKFRYLASRQTVRDNLETWKPFSKGDFRDYQAWVLAKDQKDEAKQSQRLTKLLKDYPNSPASIPAQLLLAFNLEKSRKKTEALQGYKKILEQEARPADALMARIGILRCGGTFSLEPDAITKEHRAEADRWATLLSNKSFPARAQAGKQLAAEGQKADPVLRVLAQHKNPEVALMAKQILDRYNASELAKAMLIYQKETSTPMPKKGYTRDFVLLRNLSLEYALSEVPMDQKPTRLGWSLLPANVSIYLGRQPAISMEMFQPVDFAFKCGFMSEKDLDRFLDFTGLRPANARLIEDFGQDARSSLRPAEPKFKPVHPVVKKYADDRLSKFFWVSHRYNNYRQPIGILIGPPVSLFRLGFFEFDKVRGFFGGITQADAPTFVRQGDGWKIGR